MKILCVCPIGIGNYILTYPACAAIKKAHPDYSLHLLGLRFGIAELARRDSLWDGIHVFDPTKLGANPFNKLSIILSLRREKFDASLNFFPSNKAAYNLLPFLAGIHTRFGFRYHYRPATTLPSLLNHTIVADEHKHDVDQNLALASSFLGTTALMTQKPAFPQLYSEQDRTEALSYIQKLGFRTAIAVHAGSSADHGMAHKRWAPEKFAQTADKICRMLDTACLIFGGNDEEHLKQAVASGMKASHHILPQMSLRKTAALLGVSKVCLCNDSGLMHMAACAGTPTIAVFGPTDEKRNGPAGAPTLVVRKPMTGFPLWSVKDVGARHIPKGVHPSASLEALSAEEAWQQIEPWIAELP